MKFSKQYSRAVTTWLLVGVVMVFFQVIIGGITRLTESGLSITKWEVVSGTLPPMSDQAWQHEFDLYKETPQYKEINEGMSFEDFKFIYFWEYVHRLWARLMGFVFIIPFVWFMMKKQLDKTILKNLGVVILLAILAATFGWIMVASGLIERPWVNAYNLSVHLMIAFGVFIALYWTYLRAKYERPLADNNPSWLRKGLVAIAIIFTIQVFLGSVFSGMRAAVVYPTWPDMYGKYFPDIIFNAGEWNLDNFVNYDKNAFMPALIHFLHRNTAYLLLLAGSYFGIRTIRFGRKEKNFSLVTGGWLLIIVLLIQALLGILTVINSQGKIPVSYGVLHQADALLITGVMVYLFFIIRRNKAAI